MVRRFLPALVVGLLLLVAACSDASDSASGRSEAPASVVPEESLDENGVLMSPSSGPSESGPGLSPTPSLPAASSPPAGESERASQSEPAETGAPTLEPSEPFSTATITLVSPDGERVDMPVYVAADREQRAFGLMERDDLPDGTGMIFLFPRASNGAFYMYKTRIPLSIAFADADGSIVAILDMEPCEEEDPSACELYSPGATYRSALEVEQGFFDEIGLTEEWRVEFGDRLAEPS